MDGIDFVRLLPNDVCSRGSRVDKHTQHCVMQGSYSKGSACIIGCGNYNMHHVSRTFGGSVSMAWFVARCWVKCGSLARKSAGSGLDAARPPPFEKIQRREAPLAPP